MSHVSSNGCIWSTLLLRTPWHKSAHNGIMLPYINQCWKTRLFQKFTSHTIHYLFAFKYNHPPTFPWQRLSVRTLTRTVFWTLWLILWGSATCEIVGLCMPSNQESFQLFDENSSLSQATFCIFWLCTCWKLCSLLAWLSASTLHTASSTAPFDLCGRSRCWGSAWAYSSQHSTSPHSICSSACSIAWTTLQVRLRAVLLVSKCNFTFLGYSDPGHFTFRHKQYIFFGEA